MDWALIAGVGFSYVMIFGLMWKFRDIYLWAQARRGYTLFQPQEEDLIHALDMINRSGIETKIRALQNIVGHKVTVRLDATSKNIAIHSVQVADLDTEEIMRSDRSIG